MSEQQDLANSVVWLVAGSFFVCSLAHYSGLSERHEENATLMTLVGLLANPELTSRFASFST